MCAHRDLVRSSTIGDPGTWPKFEGAVACRSRTPLGMVPLAVGAGCSETLFPKPIFMMKSPSRSWLRCWYLDGIGQVDLIEHADTAMYRAKNAKGILAMPLKLAASR